MFRPAIGLALTLAVACAAPAPVETAPEAATAPVKVAAPPARDPRFWPEPVMDRQAPVLPAMTRPSAVMIFSKTNGFRDDAQIQAANAALAKIVADKGWDGFVTENAAVFNPSQLARFDVIVLNSISGNTFTEEQRAAFRSWLEAGGGLVALHGSGGDPQYDWKWYVDTILGAQFIGHTGRPKQFQRAMVRIADPDHPAMRGLPTEWWRVDEWYAFDRVPSGHGTKILARLDESSYEPPERQRMGDHPIIWTRCIERGRVFYSAMGHKAETYSEPLHLKMIDGAIGWAQQAKRLGCQ